MNDSFLNSANAPYVAELFFKYKEEPKSIDKSWHDFFYNLKDEEILYMGDDIPDLPCLKAVGISTCPNDAAIEIRDSVDYISHIDGGKGCVRDVLEQTMRVQNKWLDKDAYSW